MKSNPHRQYWGMKISSALKAMALLSAVSMILAARLAGQLVTPPQVDPESPSSKEKNLSEKVMADLPHYEAVPAAVAAPKPIDEETAEVVPLVPYVIRGDRGIKLNEAELRTKQAVEADLRKQYGYSIFSLFQHREDVRLQDMASLQSYSESLMLAGDFEGSDAIKKESSRLFLRPHDPESEAIDTLFNPRVH